MDNDRERVPSVSRRRFVRTIGAASVVGAGYLSATDRERRAGTIDPLPISGTVVDANDDPIDGASVEFVREGDVVVETVGTDRRGTFEAPFARPVWVRVRHPGYTSQIRAVGPGEETRFRLRRDTVSLRFTGDVMFGRRFQKPNDDPTAPRVHLDESTPLEAHRDVVRYTAPLLGTADVTSVNLETPLTEKDPVYPPELYKYTSHPAAAEALAGAGVDYAALGNNHAMNGLEPGYQRTVAALDDAGLSYSGAGYGSDDAWEPAYVRRDELTIAYISCTTIIGDRFEVNWSADRESDGTYETESGDVREILPDNLGVAEPTRDRLEAAIRGARVDADLVVVQIHGGNEYDREQTDEVKALSRHAAVVGADLVVNHHPHVAGGIEYHDGALIAWTLGNFVFDQNLWGTLRSYVLNAEVTDEGVVRAAVEPIVIEGYTPRGVTGDARKRILRETAAYSSSAFRVRGDVLEAGRPGYRASTTERTAELRESRALLERRTGTGVVEAVRSIAGTVRFGRDRLATGDFADSLVDDRRFGGPLWRYGREGSPTIGPELGRDGSGGARLTRHERNEERAFLSPRHRLRVHEIEYTLSVTYRATVDENASLLVGWYDDRGGDSLARSRYDLPDTDNEWTVSSFDLEAPPEATHVNFFALLDAPSSTGTTEIVFDRIRLIEWVDGDDPSERTDHLYVDGEVAVEFGEVTDDPRSNGFDWRPVRSSGE